MVNGNYGPKYDYQTGRKFEMRVPDRILVVGNLQKAFRLYIFIHLFFE